MRQPLLIRVLRRLFPKANFSAKVEPPGPMPPPPPRRINAIHPGWVRSRTDGEMHYIGYNKLIELYNLDPRTCFNASNPESMTGRRRHQIKHYLPRSDGHYPSGNSTS